jgi:hypothetical protein
MTHASGRASTWLKAQSPAAQRRVRRLVKVFAKTNRRTGGQPALSELSMRHGIKAGDYGFLRICDALDAAEQPALDALEALDPEGGRDLAKSRLYELAYEFHERMMPDFPWQ